MAKPYRTRSSKGPGGTIRYTTQSPNSKPSSTMSYKMGTSTRVAVTRKGNGSVVQRTTQKMADGYTKRTTKTLIPKYKPPKTPKPPKIPKLKTSIAKEVKYKPPKAPKTTKPKAPKPFKFKWPTSKKSTPAKSRKTTTTKRVSTRSSNGEKAPLWTWLFWLVVLVGLLSMCSGG